MNSKDQAKYITCPVCSGKGKSKLGFGCPNCAGMGVGTFFHGRFFYFGPKLGRAMIELSHLRKKFHQGLNLITYIVGLIGILSLAYWIYGVSTTEVTTLGAFNFWQRRDFLILVFWFSLIADMFVFYRMSEEMRKQHRIKAISYEQKNTKAKLPNNWEELKKIKLKFKIDVSGGFTDDASKVEEEAYLLADELNHNLVMPIHLFFSALQDKQVSAIFSRLNINQRQLVEKLKIKLESISGQTKSLAKDLAHTDISRTVKEIFIDSYLQGSRLGQKKVTPKNFIIPIMNKDKYIKEVLYDLEIDSDKIFNVILWFIINEKQVESYRRYKQMARFKPATNMDRAYTSVATPILNKLGYDLTIAAKWGRLEYCVAREEEINKIWQHFESGVSGVMLVGPKGAGKKTVIDGIAQLMVKEDVPKFLQDKRLVELDAARLISGATPSQAQGRMMAIIDEVIRAGNIILYISDIENLIGITSGEEESLDLSEVLASAIERRTIYVLASATDQNYIKYIEGKSLGEIMPKVDVEEPVGNQAIQIIESKIGQLEGKYGVFFSYNAIEEVIKLTNKYIHDKYLPEKAISILEIVGVNTLKNKGKGALISREDIAVAISDITKIPITKITESESKNLLNLEKRIHRRMIGQKEAVDMVSASLRRARTEMREGKRPIANFLFLGPTGVGKTELAKSVAEVYFGNEDYMIRIDMSEFQHPDSIKKMIGDAQGVKGYLTEAVRKSPFSLILLDELEKAHPDILNVFLQVMDDGRLTDGQGRTIDFTNSILIATSNAGALFIQEQIYAGAKIETIKTALINEHLNKVMRPELINRFDGVIVFSPLSRENVVDIARLMLDKTKEMLEEKGIGLSVRDEGLKILAEKGYDPKFGARPLRRVLQENVDDEIASKILSGELKRRDTVLINVSAEVDVIKGEVI